MYQKFLQNLIKKHLDPGHPDYPSLTPFLQSINDSFVAFDRYRELLEHSFKLTEREFEEINNRLREESSIREKAIDNLFEITLQLEPDQEQVKSAFSDDILHVSDFVKGQIVKYNETRDQLNRTLNLFKTLLDNLNNAVLVESEDRKILFTNPTFCQLFNIPVEPDFLIGHDCTNSAEESKHLFADPDLFVSRIEHILNKREAVYDEYIEMKDGTLLERDYIPIIVDGIYKGHLWKYDDVTEKYRNQRQIAESDERNKLIMGSALDAIIISNSDGNIIYWNPSSERIFGYTAEEVVGKMLSDIIMPVRMRGMHNEAMTRIKEGGGKRILGKLLELPARNKADEEFPVEIYIINFEQDGEQYFCGFIKDISERKNNEEVLKLQEEKYRNIIANMNLGLLEVDLNDTIIFANQGFCEMSGYQLEELKGRKAAELFVSDAHKNTIISKNELRKKHESDGYEIEVNDKKGEKKWWFVSGAPNYNDKGQLVGSIGIHLDISEQKVLERELAKAKSIAEAAAKAKELFLANMSHEIRTPLNVIIGMIRQLTKEDLTTDQHFFVKQSESSAKHLLTILNNVLDVAKIESGEMEILDNPFSPSALLYNVHSIMYSQAMEKNIKFILHVSQEIKPVLIGDDTRLRQVLINLIGNAIKFTREGSILLTAEVAKETDTHQAITFEVIDTGIGMSQDFISKIFDKFSQEQNSANRKYEGTGLGMAISYDLVKLMKGDMTVDSTKEEGTTFQFTIHFPIGKSESLISKSQQIKPGAFKGLKALLVEDNEMNRFIAIQSLDFLGFETLEAENGKIAIELVKNNHFDIIFMDIQMPIMDGVEATIYIRRELKLDTPIIALTANAFKHDIELYLEQGMNDFITKPYDEPDFFRKIDHVLSLFAHQHSGLKSQAGLRDANSDLPSLYNLAQLKSMSRSDENFIIKMISIFIRIVLENDALIEDALQNQRFEEIKKLAHKIKPSIDQMGIISLKDVVRQIDKFELKAGNTAEFVMLVKTLQSGLQDVLVELKNDGYQ